MRQILDAELKKHPIANADTFLRAQELAADLRVKHPLVATECVDVVVSNRVLNLVEPQDKPRLGSPIRVVVPVFLTAWAAIRARRRRVWLRGERER